MEFVGFDDGRREAKDSTREAGVGIREGEAPAEPPSRCRLTGRLALPGNPAPLYEDFGRAGDTWSVVFYVLRAILRSDRAPVNLRGPPASLGRPHDLPCREDCASGSGST